MCAAYDTAQDIVTTPRLRHLPPTPQVLLHLLVCLHGFIYAETL